MECKERNQCRNFGDCPGISETLEQSLTTGVWGGGVCVCGGEGYFSRYLKKKFRRNNYKNIDALLPLGHDIDTQSKLTGSHGSF